MKQAFSSISARPHSASSNGMFAVWFAGVTFLLVGFYLILHGMYVYFIALAILATFVMVWQANHTAALGLVLTFLMLLGDIRRINNLLFSSPFLDPLLLVSGIFCLYLALPILIRLRISDNLSKVVLAFMALMILEVFNPQQGSLFVGFAGALFFLIPLFWYWVGRRYATEEMVHTLLFRILLPLTILDALVGFYQLAVGPLPWQRQWVEQSPGAIAFSTGHLRAFGFSTGVLEYSVILIIGTVCVMAAIFSKRWVYGLPLLILLPANVVAASRGAIVRILFGAAILWAVRGRDMKTWLPRFIFALVLGAGGTFYLASHAAVDDTRNANTAALATNRVAQGLSDSKYSTAGGHTDMVVEGIALGFKNPIGFGLGYTTLAHTKFGGQGYSSETDLSDLFMATGFPGGFLYIGIIFLASRRLIDYRRKKGGLLPLALIGVLAALLGSWFGEGQYSMQFLLFFCIGFISREAQPETAKTRQQVAARQMNVLTATT